MKKAYRSPTIFSEKTFESSALACGKSTSTPSGYVWTVTGHHTGSSHSPSSGSPYVSSSMSYDDGAYCGSGNLYAS